MFVPSKAQSRLPKLDPAIKITFDSSSNIARPDHDKGFKKTRHDEKESKSNGFCLAIQSTKGSMRFGSDATSNKNEYNNSQYLMNEDGKRSPELISAASVITPRVENNDDSIDKSKSVADTMVSLAYSVALLIFYFLFLTMQEGLYGQQSWNAASTKQRLAQTLYVLKYYHQAEQYYLESLQVMEERLRVLRGQKEEAQQEYFASMVTVGDLLWNLGQLYVATDHIHQSLECLQQCCKIYWSYLDRNDTKVQQVMHTISELELRSMPKRSSATTRTAETCSFEHDDNLQYSLEHISVDVGGIQEEEEEDGDSLCLIGSQILNDIAEIDAIEEAMALDVRTILNGEAY